MPRWLEVVRLADLRVQESMEARRYVIGGWSRDAQRPGEARVVRAAQLYAAVGAGAER